MDLLASIIQATLIYGTPIIIAGLGGLYSERSGVVNIALEGIMMIGGFTAATLIYFLEPYFLQSYINWAPWLAILGGALAGLLISLLHAYLSINLRSDQTISGTAINIFAGGITVYLAGIIFNQQRTEAFSRGFLRSPFPLLNRIPLLGDLFFNNLYPTVYVAIAVVVFSWYLLYKTAFGLRLRATGENPQAVDSLGIRFFGGLSRRHYDFNANHAVYDYRHSRHRLYCLGGLDFRKMEAVWRFGGKSFLCFCTNPQHLRRFFGNGFRDADFRAAAQRTV